MLPFISRHIPTAAQQATVAELLGDLVCTDPVTFEPGTVSEQVAAVVEQSHLTHDGHADGCPRRTSDTIICACPKWRLVAGVFPGWALIELLRDGWTVIEFQNEPSARQRGVFVCRGAFIHRAPARYFHEREDSWSNELLPSEFLPCPIPVGEQEDSPLLTGLRSASGRDT